MTIVKVSKIRREIPEIPEAFVMQGDSRVTALPSVPVVLPDVPCLDIPG